MSESKGFTRPAADDSRERLRGRAFFLQPVYYLLTLSDLGKEAVVDAGSHRFADHIYVGRPSGRTVLGRWIDSLLLATPAARAFRRRCEEAQRAMRRVLESCAQDDSAVRVLAVPCGIPRDLLRLTDTLRRSQPSLLHRLEYHGMSSDPDVLGEARTVAGECGIRSVHFHRGDALSAQDYPLGPFDLVVSTGLGECLDDDALVMFYSHVHRVLRPGGLFFTSATAKSRLSDLLHQIAEPMVQYRSADDMRRLHQYLPWREVRLTRDRSGLQTFVMAVK